MDALQTMQLVEKDNGEVTVLELGGRLDSNTSKVLEDKVMALSLPKINRA